MNFAKFLRTPFYTEYSVAFSILLLLEICSNFFHEGALGQYENHQVLKHNYQCLEYHSQGLVFHWYRVNSEEDSDSNFQYAYRSCKLD